MKYAETPFLRNAKRVPDCHCGICFLETTWGQWYSAYEKVHIILTRIEHLRHGRN
jgi:hypothetical protein